MFNVSTLLLDNTLKPATPLTNGVISETCTRSCTRQHGLWTWPVCTTVYTAVYGSCTRAVSASIRCTGRVHGRVHGLCAQPYLCPKLPCTRPVYMVVYTCIQPVYRRAVHKTVFPSRRPNTHTRSVHGHGHGLYREHDCVDGCTRPCTHSMDTVAFTAANMARIRPCTRSCTWPCSVHGHIRVAHGYVYPVHGRYASCN